MRVFANGINVAYDIDGSGEGMVLIHGLGLGRDMWWRQVPEFSKRFRVLRYDLRGHGETDRPRGGYSFELFATDLGTLLNSLEMGRVHVVGLSLGGMIAQQFALDYPELVRSLTLADTTAKFGPEAALAMDDRANTVEAQGLEAVVDGLIGRWFTPAYIQKEPEAVDRVRKIVLSNDPWSYAQVARMVARVDFVERLHLVAAPTLIVAGAEDPATTPEMAHAMHDRIDGSALTILQHASHLSNVEQAEEFNRAVLQFLEIRPEGPERAPADR